MIPRWRLPPNSWTPRRKHCQNIIMTNSHHCTIEAVCMRSKRFSCFYIMTPPDHKWPLTYTKNNRVLPFTMGYLPPKYDERYILSFFSYSAHKLLLCTHTHTTRIHMPTWLHSSKNYILIINYHIISEEVLKMTSKYIIFSLLSNGFGQRFKALKLAPNIPEMHHFRWWPLASDPQKGP